MIDKIGFFSHWENEGYMNYFFSAHEEHVFTKVGEALKLPGVGHAADADLQRGRGLVCRAIRHQKNL